MAMVTHIQTSSPSIPSPITVHIKTLHPFAMREKLGIGADHSFQSAIPQTFFLSPFLSLGRAPAPAPFYLQSRAKPWLFVAQGRRRQTTSAFLHDPTVTPRSWNDTLYWTFSRCACCAVEACADGASRAAIFFRSHSGLSIGMPY
jgi:hypothetical protein